MQTSKTWLQYGNVCLWCPVADLTFHISIQLSSEQNDGKMLIKDDKPPFVTYLLPMPMELKKGIAVGSICLSYECLSARQFKKKTWSHCGWDFGFKCSMVKDTGEQNKQAWVVFSSSNCSSSVKNCQNFTVNGVTVRYGITHQYHYNKDKTTKPFAGNSTTV